MYLFTIQTTPTPDYPQFSKIINMLCKTSILLVGAFALGGLAAPCPTQPYTAPSTNNNAASGSITASQLTQIAPTTVSCDGAPFPEECADATTAATALNSSFKKYGITKAEEKAALIAYILFESGEFKYSKNHYPGRPGQGTRMMAMPNFIAEYASAAADPSALASAAGNVDAILATVNGDADKSFGSAAWFYSNKCTDAVKTGVRDGSMIGWQNFMTVCVGTTNDPAREEYWTKAKAVLLG